MAYTEAGVCITLEAAADLSAAQYYAVYIDSNGQAALCGADALAVGILQNKPSAAGQAATVQISGVSKVVVGTGAATAGAVAGTEAGGDLIDAGTGVSGVGVFIASGTAGDIVPMLILPRAADAP